MLNATDWLGSIVYKNPAAHARFVWRCGYYLAGVLIGKMGWLTRLETLAPRNDKDAWISNALMSIVLYGPRDVYHHTKHYVNLLAIPNWSLVLPAFHPNQQDGAFMAETYLRMHPDLTTAFYERRVGPHHPVSIFSAHALQVPPSSHSTNADEDEKLQKKWECDMRKWITEIYSCEHEELVGLYQQKIGLPYVLEDVVASFIVSKRQVFGDDTGFVSKLNDKGYSRCLDLHRLRARTSR
jgi:hypothetical protein